MYVLGLFHSIGARIGTWHVHMADPSIHPQKCVDVSCFYRFETQIYMFVIHRIRPTYAISDNGCVQWWLRDFHMRAIVNKQELITLFGHSFLSFCRCFKWIFLIILFGGMTSFARKTNDKFLADSIYLGIIQDTTCWWHKKMTCGTIERVQKC